MPFRQQQIFSWNLNLLAKLIIATVNNRYDFLIAISGKTGVGKSTLVYNLFRRLQRCEDRPKGQYIFNPQRDILYSQRDVLDAMNKKWKGLIFCDEMIAVAFNRDFYLDDQKRIIKSINMNRDHCNVVAMAVPTFSTLDTQMKGRIKLRIDVIRRGLAVVQTPIKSIYARDIWDTQNNEKIEREWALKNTARPQYQRLTTFRGFLTFPDLSPKHREIYEQIKIDKRNQILREEEEKEKMKKGGFIGQKALAMQLADSLEKGNIKTRADFDKACLILGQKPTEMINSVRTYNRDRGVDIKFRDYLKKWSQGDDPDYQDEPKKKRRYETIDIPKILE